METIYRDLELRSDGRTLSGPVVKYGDHARGRLELFAQDSIPVDPAKTHWLDYEHDQSKVISHSGAGLELFTNETGLHLRAELPRLPLCDQVLQEIRNGDLNGLSIEFQDKQSSYDDSGFRTIESASVSGVGIVKSPEYQNSLEVRKRRKRKPAWLRAKLKKSGGDCECILAKTEAAKKKSVQVRFDDKAFDVSLNAVKSNERNVVATLGSMEPGNILGDTRNGLLIITQAPRASAWDIALIISLFAPDDDEPAEAEEKLREGMRTNEIVVRPLIDNERSVFEDAESDDGYVRTYSDAWLRALLFKVAPGSAASGWEIPTLDPEEESRSRGLYLWL